MILFLLIFFLLFFIILSMHYYFLNRRLKSEISQIETSLETLLSGNLYHRILIQPDAQTQTICYLINKLCRNYQNDIFSLKKSEKKYKDLMINLSHDVRTPLASVLGHLELLTSSPNTALSSDFSSSLDVINRKAFELADFVEMLFQWTKLDADQENLFLSPLDINEQSRILISKWISVFEKNNIKYTFCIPEERFICNMDPTAYQRIIDNLFKNIINHSHASQMHFSVSASDSLIHISIEDNGVGIKNADQNLVFERLYQCDLSRNSKGNGLGLAIVKELVQKLNGSITLEIVPNVYTRFLLSFPLQCS